MPDDTLDKIQINQLALLNENIPRGLLLNIVIGTAFSLVMLLQSSRLVVFSWLSLLYVTSLLRFVLHKYYLPPASGRRVTGTTRYHYALASAMAGTVWGIAVFLFKPSSLGEMLPIALTLAGVMAGGISVLSYLMASYAAFAVPITLSLIVGFLTINHPSAQALGIMLIVYMIACLYFGRAFNSVLTESLRLKFRNDELLRELRREKDVADQANMEKSRFLAAASHDLRQPLHALSLLFESLKSSDPDHSRQSLYGKIDLSLDTLSSLFNNLLDISKLDAGAVEVNIEDFNICEVASVAMNEQEPEAKRKNIFIRGHCSDVVVRSDRLFLERIIRNLLSNAVRYTHHGGVLVSCRVRNDHVRLQVWDTGIGIEKEEKSAVFCEFYQLHNTHRDRNQGLGLGLSIVRRLCDLLDHPLSLESRPGSGTVVTVLIPKGDPSSTTATENPAAYMPWNLQDRHILVVDDDIEILQATSRLLSGWGCIVSTAASSSDAMDIIRTYPKSIDIILSDLRLVGDENGIETLNTICNYLDDNVPAILITGDTDPERIRLAQKSGYKLLHKPLKPVQLRTALHQVLVARTATWSDNSYLTGNIDALGSV